MVLRPLFALSHRAANGQCKWRWRKRFQSYRLFLRVSPTLLLEYYKVSDFTSDQAKETLLSLLGDKPRIYGICTSVAASGMSRKLHLFVVVGGEIRNIDFYVAALCGYSRDKKGGEIIRRGCGMDFLFDTVYSVSKAVFDDGYKINHEWL